jgi:hypothetical protein
MPLSALFSPIPKAFQQILNVIEGIVSDGDEAVSKDFRTWVGSHMSNNNNALACMARMPCTLGRKTLSSAGRLRPR